MCGISGYSGIANPASRLALTAALGSAIVSRGTGGAGYVGLDGQGGIFHDRVIASWRNVTEEFLTAAAANPTCMMHSRGPISKVPTDVHPFPITRNDQIVMWGAHNGMFDDAWDSAKENGRKITVDSQELFELLADGRTAELAAMRGWGVINWVTNDDPNNIKISIMGQSGELVGARLEEGGVVFASTSRILEFGVAAADLHISEMIEFQIGRTYLISNDNIVLGEGGVTMRESWGYYGWN